MPEGKYVSYLRVSTDKQGRDGLGIDAQRAAVARYLNGGDWALEREFVEQESGKRNDRPELAKALAYAKAIGATVIVGKLDRLSRDAQFLMGIVNSGASIVFCDLPQVPPGATGLFLIGIMAQVAQLERGLTSERTKAALAALRQRLKDGQCVTSKGLNRLGSPRGADNLRDENGRISTVAAVAAVRKDAADRAEEMRPIFDDIMASGAVTDRQITDELARRGILTPRGGRWHPTMVARLRQRLAGTHAGKGRATRPSMPPSR